MNPIEPIPSQQLLETIRLKMNEKLKDSSFVESRLMGLEVFPRLVVKLADLSDYCPQCRQFVNDAMQVTETIEQVVDGEHLKEKKAFEAKMSEMTRHLEKDHRCFPRGKIRTIVFALVLLLNLFIAFLFGNLADFTIGQSLLLGWLSGMVTGYISGIWVEKKLGRENRLW